ncbi:MAG: sulfatase [Roseibacillus sp.]
MKCLLSSICVLGALCGSLFAGKPNIILIFADDQGYEDLGCYGSKMIKTPHLDRLAREGMRFTDFYAQPICGPSRTALMTGCYPLRVAERGNVKNIHPHLHSKEITIAEVLKPQGYATGCFGKWDLAKHSQRQFHRDLMPNHQGFDYFFGTPTSNDGYVDLFRNEKRIGEKAPMGTLTKRYTDEAIAFIRKHKDEPFFVYLPHTMPHTRLAASEQFKGKSPRGLYGDVIEEIDFSVGRIVEAVKELKLEDKTWIIYTSDNGPWLIKNKGFVDGERPPHHGGSAGSLRSGKVSTWEGGVRVPAIVWAPGRVPAGTVCQSLATTMDLLPTFAQLAGTKAPSDRVIDGEDISHLFRGEFGKADLKKTYFYYFLTHLQAVRQGNWKLVLARPENPKWLGPHAENRHIHSRDDGEIVKAQLFNLEKDIGESKNVAGANPEVVNKLLALAESAREDIGDYDRVGKNMRFFDPFEKRPEKPMTPWVKQ